MEAGIAFARPVAALAGPEKSASGSFAHHAQPCRARRPFSDPFRSRDVAPALVPDFGYDDLLEVADGNDASTVFYQLASCKSLSDERRADYRRALLTYCARDTLALLTAHRALQMRCQTELGPVQDDVGCSVC